MLKPVLNQTHVVLLQLLSNAGAILLQREIPEAVNIEVAKVRCTPRES